MHLCFFFNIISQILFQFNGESCCSWSDIVQLHRLEQDLPLKKAPQLTNDHVHPTLSQKMKVSLATQVLSHRTAAALRSSSDSLSSTALQTAELVDVFNAVFDFCNANNLKEVGTRRPAMTQLWLSQQSVIIFVICTVFDAHQTLMINF